ncbi:hypothetical protein BZA77DRAFT_247311 [Pyronema omphalodes]|nr:hypothetical protein BZA77DRAFT_247311 [Pyronema omphalodes]
MPDDNRSQIRHELYDKAAVSLLWISCLLSLILILTRLIWRYRRGETYSKDDKWMAIAIIPLILRLITSQIINTFLTSNFDHNKYSHSSMTEEEIHRRIVGSIMVLPSRIMYAGVLWAMKASILYCTFVDCRPIHLYWQIWPDPGRCVRAKIQLIVMAALNIVTDLYLIAIPLPLVIRARLPLKRKLQLSFLFSLSFLIVIVTITRMAGLLRRENKLSQQSRSLWASIEIFIACIVANAPILNSFFQTVRQQNLSNQGGAGRSKGASLVQRQARMPVTGQNSFGSLTRNDGMDSVAEPVCRMYLRGF